MEVKCGEAIAVMESSGCGKTTLLDNINRLDRPTTGAIMIDGLKLMRSCERELEKHGLLAVSFVFQTFDLVTMLSAVVEINCS